MSGHRRLGVGSFGSAKHGRLITIDKDGHIQDIKPLVIKVGLRKESSRGAQAYAQAIGVNPALYRYVIRDLWGQKDRAHKIHTRNPINTVAKKYKYISAQPDRGMDLKAFFDAHREALSPQAKVKIFIQMYERIKQLHSWGYSHHDIKPANVCIQYDEHTQTFHVHLVDLEGISSIINKKKPVRTAAFRGQYKQSHTHEEADLVAWCMSILHPIKTKYSLLKMSEELPECERTSGNSAQKSWVKLVTALYRSRGSHIPPHPASDQDSIPDQADRLIQTLAQRVGLTYPGWKVDLKGQNLSEQKRNYAKLNHADLSNATLTNTNLKGANLTGANLTGADLTGADLTGADLTGANLTEANLEGARYELSQLDATQIKQVKLTTAFIQKVDDSKKGTFVKEWMGKNGNFYKRKTSTNVRQLPEKKYTRSYLRKDAYRMPSENCASWFFRGNRRGKTLKALGGKEAVKKINTNAQPESAPGSTL